MPAEFTSTPPRVVAAWTPTMYSGRTPSSTTDGILAHDPSFEWPGDDLEAKEHLDAPATSFLRLVAHKSTCLPSKRRLAILTGFPEVQIGRDKPPANSHIPRIRLKELEVSKFHATVYWDSTNNEWGIVDMGSMHGTYLSLHNAAGPPHGASVRLSPSRIASLPHTLHHLDELSIGSTTFSVHIHDSNLPCDVCSSSSSNEIPLFSVDEGNSQSARLPQVPKTGLVPQAPKDARKSLSLLKQNLIRQHEPSVGSSSSAYIDRAARRRQIHGHSGAPGVTQTATPPPQSATTTSSYPEASAPPREPKSGPSTPLPTSNVGHQLLSKMGWERGQGLGLGGGEDGGGIVEPVQVKQLDKRAGLGTKRPSSAIDHGDGGDWQQIEKERRYAALRSLSGGLP